MPSFNYGKVDNNWINERIRERAGASAEMAAAFHRFPQIFVALEAALRRQVEHYNKAYSGSMVDIQTSEDQLVIRQTTPVREVVTITKDPQTPAVIAKYENPARTVVMKLKGYNLASSQKVHELACKIIDPLLFPDLQA